MTQWLASIDQGTTSTRCIAFDTLGRRLAMAQMEHAQIYPQPGWVEHDATEIWRNTQTVISTTIAQSGLAIKDCRAIGITNQRETTVLWNKRTGIPVANALVWQDTRVNESVAKLAADGHGESIRTKTGLPLASYFSGLKLQWLLDHVPNAQAMAERGDLLFGTMDSWLVWNLTGGISGGLHVTDVTNASRTQLLSLSSLQWDDELLKLFRVPRAVLPRIAASSEVYAEATCTSLKGVPIAGILGDQQAALVGQVCFQPGEAKNTYGTGCFMLMNTGTSPPVSNSGLLATVAYQFGKSPCVYALEGSIAIAGALVQWLRDNMQLFANSNEIEELAKTVADNGDVYIVPAFSGLYAPYWREDARGVIAGLTRFANRGHIARASLECVAYQTLDVITAMHQDAGIHLKELRVDGGMVANELLMQFQADILNVPVVAPNVTETTALGAAYAAGFATGVWSDLEALRLQWAEARRWTPSLPQVRREQLCQSWHKAVTRSFDWVGYS